MPGIVITGHGGFASGLLQAVEQVVGAQPACVAVDFPVHMGTAELSAALLAALQAVKQPDGVVFLTDMLGGSPFRCASELADTQGNCEVLTGVNMQLAAEMMLEREGLSLDAFRDMALACGKRGLTSLWHERRKVRCENAEADGI
ncbi:PTS system N-acetylgalactosamine-specific EIIA component (Man family) [Serratia fonticola]|jgi:PTS system N-acetylgalactosamine-specific IIA component|uniref:PTS system N-acetylgalactosamine-specific EIIA component (Man family) n=1 Tax=Serratia fonticola TaxID=47917 RepID=A0A542CYX6_SERFO|nr:PTS galactosamine/N-acetylgalactosamine transporter subunit IIA [Serratia fonticola]TQI81970.1 PTS system N-acetylgalactosamine-specific EIIA component (Man family) [Serratia fonticola]TQI96007.1 PTS system N-acetylgalactosamine-specific EIIA component (Man family) [Serratia fonticola]TVZ70504.1 PTS system N-acetylgalactosamine-specific EIIA component (Man family) [Serratia fonticola]